LSTFSKKLGAGAQWQFYTGALEASVSMQKAFDIYRGDKMNHIPVTYLRAAPGKPWVRLDGLRSPEEIIKEYKAVLAKG
jgi:protein SCO1/2